MSERAPCDTIKELFFGRYQIKKNKNFSNNKEVLNFILLYIYLYAYIVNSILKLNIINSIINVSLINYRTRNKMCKNVHTTIILAIPPGFKFE